MQAFAAGEISSLVDSSAVLVVSSISQPVEALGNSPFEGSAKAQFFWAFAFAGWVAAIMCS